MACESSLGKKYNIRPWNKFFKSVARFKYSGTTQTKQNCIHAEFNTNSTPRNLSSIWSEIVLAIVGTKQFLTLFLENPSYSVYMHDCILRTWKK